ncbi:MAG: hypothetical protein JRI23_10630 [Deltaproteobacteria bacterium]|jgi:hypothetical protein|nr:hypothetical protein [Deltaproteobacteria bacterium]MBW2532132.1 hypothetical protein [Deltaproteobacteria bacterium]
MKASSSAAVLAPIVVAAACSQVLGIDDFTDAEGAAGATTTASSGGAGGTTPTGTSTGTASGGGGSAAFGWSLRFGGDGEDNAAAVAVVGDDSIVLGGDFGQSIDFGGPTLQRGFTIGCDGFVAMLDGDGAHQFTYHLTGDEDERVEDIAVSSSNGIIVGGWYQFQLTDPDDTFDWGTWGSDEVFLLGLNTAGALQWRRRGEQGGLMRRATAVASGATVPVVATGYFAGTVEIADDQLVVETNQGPDDGFVGIFDAVGGSVGAEDFGVGGYQRPQDVTVLSDDSIIMVGDCTGAIDESGSYTCHDSGDVFLIEYHGNVRQRVKCFGDTAVDQVHAVATDGTDIVLVGEFGGHIDFDSDTPRPLDNKGGRDLFVAKLGPDFSHQWSLSFGGLYDDAAHDVAVDSSGRVVVTGVVRDEVDFGDGQVHPDGGDADVFVLVLDSDGALEWVRRYGADGDQEGRSVAVDASDQILLFGNLEGTIDFGHGPRTAVHDSRDVFLAKLASDPR